MPARQRPTARVGKKGAETEELAELTVPEVRRLLAIALPLPPGSIELGLACWLIRLACSSKWWCMRPIFKIKRAFNCCFRQSKRDLPAWKKCEGRSGPHREGTDVDQRADGMDRSACLVWHPKDAVINWDEIIPPGFHMFSRLCDVERIFM